MFSALIQTTRTLRLRRNLVKLALYRHFTNTLVFSVFASVIFMLWSIKFHKMEECLTGKMNHYSASTPNFISNRISLKFTPGIIFLPTDWRNLWLDEAFWHLLFSTILVSIMFLWRPSQNNQRYAFTPLLDYEGTAKNHCSLHSVV